MTSKFLHAETRPAIRRACGRNPVIAVYAIAAASGLVHAAGPTTTFQVARGLEGQDVITGVAPHREGGFLTVGWRQGNATTRDIWLTRANYAGVQLWERTIGSGDLNETGFHAVATRDGGFAVVAERSALGALPAGVVVFKVNSTGTLQWGRLLITPTQQGDFAGAAITESPSGDLVVAGRWGLSAAQQRMMLARFTSAGVSVWASTYGDARHTTGISALLDVEYVNADPPVLVAAGYTQAEAGAPRQALITRINFLNGNQIQTRIYTPITISAFANGVAAIPGGGVAFTARITAPAENDSLFIITNSAFTPAVSQRFGRFLIADRSIHSIPTATPVSGFAFAGTFPFGSTLLQTFGLFRVSSDGTPAFRAGYGGTGNDLCLAMAPTADDGFLLAGSTDGFGAQLRDGYIVKADSLGRSACNPAESIAVISNFEAGGDIIELTRGSVEQRTWEAPSSDRASRANLLCLRCPADFNQNGTIDFFDYLDYVIAYDAEQPSADFNGNGVIDFFDYLDFVEFFTRGC